jgi:hypothetical protein
LRLITWAIALALLTACSTVRVSVDYDPEEDFTTYSSYAWLPQTPEATGHPRADSPMVQRRLRSGVDRALANKGFREVSSDPDFWVTFHMSVAQKLDVSTSYTPYRRYGYTMSIPETEVREYEEGTVIIDIVDARERELVWRGIGRGRLRRAAPEPEKQEEIANEVAAEILSAFPPGSAG